MDDATAQREDSRQKAEASPEPVDDASREFIGRKAHHEPISFLLDTTFGHMQADIVAKLQVKKEDEPQARKVAEYIAAEIRPMVKDLHPLANLRVLVNIGQQPEFKPPFPDAPYFSELVDAEDGTPQSHLSAPNETPPDLKTERVAYGLAFMVQPVERHTNERMWGWGIGDSPVRTTRKTIDREAAEYAALHARAAEREVQHTGHQPHPGQEEGLGSAALATAAGLGLAGAEFFTKKEEDRKKDFEVSDRNKEEFFKQKEEGEQSRRAVETQNQERDDKARDDNKRRLDAEDDVRRKANAIADQAAKVESLLAQIRENQESIRLNPRNSPLLMALAAALGGLRVAVGGAPIGEGALLGPGLEEVAAAVQPWATTDADRKKEDEDSESNRKAEDQEAEDQEAEDIEADETARVESLLAAIEAHEQTIPENPVESSELNALSQAEIQLGISAGRGVGSAEEDRAGIDIDTGRKDLSQDEEDEEPGSVGTAPPLDTAAQGIRAQETSAEPVVATAETQFDAAVPQYAQSQTSVAEEEVPGIAPEAAAEITGGPSVTAEAAALEPQEPVQPTVLQAQAPSVIGEHLEEEARGQVVEQIGARPETGVAAPEFAEPGQENAPAVAARPPVGEAGSLAELRPDEAVQPTVLQTQAPSVIGSHLEDEARGQVIEEMGKRPETGVASSETAGPKRSGEATEEEGAPIGAASGAAVLKPDEVVQPTTLQAQAPSVIGSHFEDEARGQVIEEIGKRPETGVASSETAGPKRPGEATEEEGAPIGAASGAAVLKPDEVVQPTTLQAQAPSVIGRQIEDEVRGQVINSVGAPLRNPSGAVIAPLRARTAEDESNTGASAQGTEGVRDTRTVAQPQSAPEDRIANQSARPATAEDGTNEIVEPVEAGRRGTERTTAAAPNRQTGGVDETEEDAVAGQVRSGRGALDHVHEAETIAQLAAVRINPLTGQPQASQSQAGTLAGAPRGEMQTQTKTTAGSAQGVDTHVASENAEEPVGNTVREEIARSAAQTGAPAVAVVARPNSARAANPQVVPLDRQASPASKVPAENTQVAARAASGSPKAAPRTAAAPTGKTANDRNAKINRNVAERAPRDSHQSRPARRIAEATRATRQPATEKQATTARRRVQAASPPQNIASPARVRRVVKAQTEISETHPFGAVRRTGRAAAAASRAPRAVNRIARAAAVNPHEKMRSKRFVAPGAKAQAPKKASVVRPAASSVKPTATMPARRLPSQRVMPPPTAQRKTAVTTKPAISRKAQPLRAPRSQIRRSGKPPNLKHLKRFLHEPEPE